MSISVLDAVEENSQTSSSKRGLFKKHVNHVDPLLALRGIACMFVLIGHCYIAMPPISTQFMLLGHDITWALCPYAAVGMYIFFTLSGYLMGNQFFSGKYNLTFDSVKRFYKARALRIAPLFYSLTIFYLIFDGSEMLKPGHLSQLLKIFTFTYNIWPFPYAGQHFWSIATEMQFYLVVPLVFFLLKPFRKNGLALTLALVGVILFTEFYRISEYPKTLMLDGHQDMLRYFRRIYFPLVGNFDVFFIGFWLNAVFAWHENLNPVGTFKRWSDNVLRAFNESGWQLRSGWLAVIALYVVSSYLFHSPLIIGVAGNLVFPILSAICIAYFIATARATERHVENEPVSLKSWKQNKFRTLDAIGVLSYGIYLWHVTLLGRMKSTFIETSALEGYYLLVATTAFVAILFATATYFGIEKPFNNLRRKTSS